MTRKILVLSSTGTTGSETVRALVERGASVRAATRSPQKATFSDNVEVVRFDFADPTTWGPALEGVDALYFAMPPFLQNELDAGLALIRAATEAGVRRIVKLSALGVEANPESGHRQQELAIEASGVHWVHLRPNFFMDNFVTLHGEPITRDGAIYLPAGEALTSFIAASDIGDIAATALLGDMTGEAWALTGGESLDHATVAHVIATASGREVRYVDLPPEAFVQALKAQGMPAQGVQTMAYLYNMVRQGWVAPVIDDAARVLEREPITFQTWAQQHAEAWRA